jgi:hypothetical protein
VNVKKVDWQSYEQLAAKIYRRLEADAVVKHDDSIYGHDSETYRQIDVSIRRKVEERDVLVIVQARDRKKAPDINAVGEFATVIRDVRADKGVLICRKPPGKSAKKLAKVHNIELCSAFDVNDHKWSEDIAVPVVVTLKEVEIEPSFTFPAGSGFKISLPPKPAPGFVSRDSGKSRTTLFDFMVQHVLEDEISRSGSHELIVRDDELSILLNEADWVPLPHLQLRTTLTVRKLFRHCKPDEYLALRNYSTGSLAITEMKLVLPAFNDADAWQEAATIEPYEKVVENVPVVDLRLSAMARSGKFGFRVLPLAIKADW